MQCCTSNPFFVFVLGMSVSEEMLSLLSNLNLIWLQGAENSLTAVMHGFVMCVSVGVWLRVVCI